MRSRKQAGKITFSEEALHNPRPRETHEQQYRYLNIPEPFARLPNTFRALSDISERVIEIPKERLYIGMADVILSGDAERRTVVDVYLLTAGSLIRC